MLRYTRSETSLPARPLSSTRRHFLNRVGSATAAAVAVSAVGLPSLSSFATSAVHAANKDDSDGEHQRINQAYQVRHRAAFDEKNVPIAPHSTNGDEELYPNRIGNYSKALPHNSLGEVDLYAYNALIGALASGDPLGFESIPVGGAVKLSDPQASYAFDLEGTDSHCFGINPPPAFSSAEAAGEATELYWHALLRDVPFAQYDSDNLINTAAIDLSKLSDFHTARELESGLLRQHCFAATLPVI